MKILLVEDDQNFGAILKDYLSLNDFEVTLAKNGMEGFEKYKKEGEKDFSDNALKVKIGAAWGIVRFDELKDNLEGLLQKDKEKDKT